MITIETAIKDLEQSKSWYESRGATEQVEAHQLGIQALKWRLHVERVATPAQYPLLPGEERE